MKPRDPLSPVVRQFVLHWGEMGTCWGINRTVAQVHAVLLMAERPLNADDLIAALGVARSNISTSLRELQGWNVVRRVHVDGDRRDHYAVQGDVLAMAMAIINERKRREFDPTLAAVRRLAAESGDEPAAVRARLDELARFLDALGAALDQVRHLPPSALAGLLGAAGMLGKLLPKGGAP
jgi:DNA-binding transcriptional regulator GbsR (MarR family)